MEAAPAKLLLALTGWRAQKQTGPILPPESSSKGGPHSPAHPSVRLSLGKESTGDATTVECESRMRRAAGTGRGGHQWCSVALLQSPIDPALATVRAVGGPEPSFLMSSPSPASFPTVTSATMWSLRSLAQAFPGAWLHDGPRSVGHCRARTPG